MATAASNLCLETDAFSHYEAIQADIFDHILAVLPEFDLRIFQNLSGSDFQAFTTRSTSP